MNYAYDIFINPNDEYYEFFEWNKKDIIIHLKKLPIIKIDSFFLKNIINNKVFVDNEFVNKYKFKAEIFNSHTKYNYVLFTDCKCTCVIKFDNNGNIIKKSSLVFEDEINSIDIIRNNKIENINFTITKIKIDPYLTREEKNKKNFIMSNIKKISNNKLKYLYFDCFNEKNTIYDIMLKKLINEINNNNFEVWEKCHNLLSLVYIENK